MDSRNPTAEEAIRLKQLHAAHGRWPTLGLLVILPLLTLQFVFDSTWVKVALALLGLMLFIWWALSFTLLSKCPRCRARMTLPRGSCTVCGLRLEAQDTEAGTAPCSR